MRKIKYIHRNNNDWIKVQLTKVFLKSFLILVITLGLSGTFLVTYAAFPGENGKIAYVSDRGQTLEIYSMNMDGTQQTKLSSIPLSDEAIQPAWSPDGEKIVYSRYINAEGKYSIWIMNKDGTCNTRITNGTFWANNPGWSPDGNRILFWREASGDNIWVVNIDGTGLTQLTTGSSDYSPAWSPDGEKIAFVKGNADTAEIWVMDPDGSNQVKVSGSGCFHPDWSPDSKKIVYTRYQDRTDYDIYMMNRDGSGSHAVLDSEDMAFHPAFSNDGSMVVFSRGVRESRLWVDDREIWVMKSDGSEPIQVTDNDSGDWCADWQPIIVEPVGGELMTVENSRYYIFLAAAVFIISFTSLHKNNLFDRLL
jgi:TolB protein